MRDGADLVRVALKVRPLPGHPRYWELKSAILLIWLYADCRDGAIETAEQILAALPYERIGDDADVHEMPATYLPTQQQFKFREELAKEAGLSLLLLGVAVGADDAGFETMRL